MIVLIGTFSLHLVPLWAALLLAVGGYVAIEAAFRRRLVQLLLRLTVFLAIVAAVVLAIEYLWLIAVLAIGGVALLAIVDNIRELRA